MSVFKNKFLQIVGFVTVAAAILGSVSGFNPLQKIASASLVNACSASESIEANNCVFTKTPTPQYETKCAAGYTLMDAVCAKYNAQSCSYFVQGLNAESGLCKLDLSSPVYGTEINDNDGRQCNGVGTNFKRYNVGQPNNSVAGPVVCGSIFSLLDKTTFRFLPRVITEISNLNSVQTQVTYSPCPTNYIELSPNKCSRPATAQSCSVGGEIFVNNNCIPCPAGQYCPGDGVVSKSVTVCANGGELSGNKCIAPIKYSTISYIDGCTSEYIKKDQSCAVVENRTHDTGCSYFYTSENANITATQGSDGYCSTGGRTDFDSASIIRVSDFNCNGVGTYYYNYNVAYDPLVCGNDYNTVGKTGFKWLPQTFTKITALQKIPSTSLACPVGWVSFDSSNNCSQAPITQEYRHPIDCPINTYCPGSNNAPIPCPAGSTSPSRSTKLSDCIYTICKNGATNPPSCNKCPSGLQLISGTCLPVCPSGVNRDSNNNCTVCVNGAVNPSSGCNACQAGYIFNGSSCVVIPNIVCKHGFEKVDNSCLCPLPKITIYKKVSPRNDSIAFCESPIVSSSSTLSSTKSSSSVSSSSSFDIASSSTLASSSSSSSNISSSSSSISSISMAIISGYVYVDINNNGIFENNESPIGGVTITLIGTQDSCKNVNTTTTTTTTGYYQFSNLVPCTYSVIQTQPSGYNSTITTSGTINGVKVGTINTNNKIENITITAGQSSINNNFGEILINLSATNSGGGTTVINNNNPTTNNNLVNNNIVNNYQSPATPLVTAPIASPVVTITQPIQKPNFIPMASPVNSVVYYQSPVVSVTETIRSGGFNIIIIISTIVAAFSFAFIYMRGKRNQGFGDYTFENNISD